MGCILKALVTVELQLCSDLFSFPCLSDCRKYKVDVLFCTGLVCNNKLRHSTASVLIEKGWDIKSIQLWLRHADVKTTLNIYTHIKKDKKMDMAQSIERAFLV